MEAHVHQELLGTEKEGAGPPSRRERWEAILWFAITLAVGIGLALLGSLLLGLLR